MTLEKLRSFTRKELASMARRDRVSGWHSMRKEELIQALVLANRSRKARKRRSSLTAAQQSARSQPESSLATRLHRRDLTTIASSKPARGSAGNADTLHVEVIDPYWLRAQWSLTREVVQRAQASLGVEWHVARPVLRLFSMSGDDVRTNAKTWLRDLDIHGEVDNWFIPVDNPPNVYRVEIGYLAPSGKFYALAASNIVRTPRPGSQVQVQERGRKAGAGSNDLSASSQSDEAFPLRRIRWELGNNGPGAQAGNSSGSSGSAPGDFLFRVDTELVIHGLTHPDADVTLSGDKVKLNKDGSFSLRVSLPEGRQVIPAVTVTPWGAEQRTIVLSVERNTKELEPQPLDEMSQL